MYELVVESEFAAAHCLREYQGACERLHGHNWRVELVVGGETLDRLGMVMDFRDLKRILREVLDRFEHHFLNDLPEFQKQNPTTENMARVIYEECARRMPAGVRVRNVGVWETPRAGARYSAGT
jgi:6-pyruvoyltetrahydropterin/6-carboxytetrahydropterin synthase